MTTCAPSKKIRVPNEGPERDERIDGPFLRLNTAFIRLKSYGFILLDLTYALRRVGRFGRVLHRQFEHLQLPQEGQGVCQVVATLRRKPQPQAGAGRGHRIMQPTRARGAEGRISKEVGLGLKAFLNLVVQPKHTDSLQKQQAPMKARCCFFR